MKSNVILSLVYLLYHHKIHNCSSWIPTLLLSNKRFSNTNSLTKNSIFPPSNNKKSRELELKSTKSKNEQQTQEWKVIHQKVLSKIPISYIISYIRDIFPIPSNLPLPYQRSTLEKYKDVINEEGGSVISSFVCSMDENVYSTSNIPKSSLVVQVLGICVEDSIPSMAMVSIKKLKDGGGNGMMLGLEEASEKQLIHALERGLDDLVASRGYAFNTPFSSSSDTKEPKKQVQSKNDKKVDNNKANDDKEIKSIIDLIPTKKKESVDVISKEKEIKSIIDLIPTNKKDNTINPKENEPSLSLEHKDISLDEIVPNSIEESVTKSINNDDNIDTSLMEEGVELTPQELLDDMLSFDEKEKELNFGNNALHKAKELLKSQKQDNLLDTMRVVGINEEEELKRMFAQGQQLAKSRMNSNVDDDWLLANKKGEYVDELIQKETSIKDGVQLEQDLAEFEIRVASRNPSTNENYVSNTKDFDIFTNPNIFQSINDLPIDPTTENYPGSITPPRNLPSELKEAFENAQFASKLLTSLREEEIDDTVKYYIADKELTIKQVQNIIQCVEESIKVGFIPDPFIKMEEENSLNILLNELEQVSSLDDFDEERFQEIVQEYKDLLLSDNFISLVREKLKQPAQEKQQHELLRFHLSKLVKYAMFLLKETQVYGSQLEAQQLEIIRSICEVAMDETKTEQETALALQDKVRTMKPLLDDVFVSYLKYAIQEEEARLARRGILDSMEHFGENQWLMVLKIVQAGVYAELSKGINRHLEHIWYVLRMETRHERKMLLSKIIEDMPTLDIRPFVKVVDNIASSLGSTAKGQFRDDGYELSKLTNKILQLSKDVHELLPPEKIAMRSRDADEWLKRKREGFLEERREAKERLKQSLEKKRLSDSGGKIITEEEGGLYMP